MHNYVQVFAFLLWLCSAKVHHHIYSNIQQKVPYADAVCINDGEVLGRSQDDYPRLAELVRGGTKPVWVNATMQRFGALTWINGSSVDDRQFAPNNAQCGSIDVFEKQFYEFPCQVLRPSLCQLKGNRKCPITSKTCFSVGQYEYYAEDADLNWYQARDKCSSQRGGLAIIEKYENDIFQELGRQHSDIDQKEFWIGSRTLDWEVLLSDDIPSYNWLPGQPIPDKDCVVITNDLGQIGLQTYSCDLDAFFVCSAGKLFLQTTDQNEATTLDLLEGKNGNHSVFLRTAPILNSAVICILLLACIFFCAKSFRRNRPPNEGTDERRETSGSRLFSTSNLATE